MRFALACALLAVPFAAVAAPASIADCERIAEPLAYNACLAEFGPRVGERPARSAAEPQRRRAPASPRRGADGRKSATFDVVTGKKPRR